MRTKHYKNVLKLVLIIEKTELIPIIAISVFSQAQIEPEHGNVEAVSVTKQRRSKEHEEGYMKKIEDFTKEKLKSLSEERMSQFICEGLAEVTMMLAKEAENKKQRKTFESQSRTFEAFSKIYKQKAEGDEEYLAKWWNKYGKFYKNLPKKKELND